MLHVQFVKARLLASPPSTPRAFLWATMAALAPTLIRASLDGAVADTTFPTFFPFILLAAIFLGWRPAVLTAALSALAANYLFMGPQHELFATAQETAGTLVFLASASFVIFAAETLRSAHQAANLERRLELPAARPLRKGHALLLGAVLSLGLWVGAIWAGLRLLG